LWKKPSPPMTTEGLNIERSLARQAEEKGSWTGNDRPQWVPDPIPEEGWKKRQAGNRPRKAKCGQNSNQFKTRSHAKLPGENSFGQEGQKKPAHARKKIVRWSEESYFALCGLFGHHRERLSRGGSLQAEQKNNKPKKNPQKGALTLTGKGPRKMGI